MKLPPYEDRQRCIRLRCAAKIGNHLMHKDAAFLRKMREKYPEWYEAAETLVEELVRSLRDDQEEESGTR